MTGTGDDVARTLEFARLVQAEGRLDRIDEFVAPDFRNRTAEPGQRTDREGVRATMAALHAALDDIVLEVVHCFERDGVVATHKVFHGRHVGDWLGQAPTGGRVSFRVMDFLRFEDGLIVEHWSALRPLADGES